MNNKQSNHLDMFNATKQVYTTHQAVIDSVQARGLAFTTFTGNVAAINSNIATQSMVTTGVTTDKGVSRTALNELSGVIFGIARAWALANNDNTNAEDLDFSMSDLAHIKDDTIIPFLNHRKTIIENNATALEDYGITTEIIDAWTDSITAFDTHNTLPRAVIIEIGTSTEQLELLFKGTMNLLRNTIDPLMRLLKATNPLLYARYIRARIIIDRGGTRPSDPQPASTNVNGAITDAATGQPIEDVLLILSANGDSMEARTDATGRYNLPIDGLDENFTGILSASHPDFVSDSRQITIVPNEDRNEDFGLNPAPPTP